MAMNTLEELRYLRKNLRTLKADNLRTMRRYARTFGSGDSLASYMSGMANGKTAALSQLDYLINRLEMEKDYGNA